ncbi:unnamed protein product [Ilex paraguariensis]|uniref:Uncharacterized protein n=1 Tax=Ilex paraguariensis TaxID=185542 RepID=A0ABC8R4T8_9AQUA
MTFVPLRILKLDEVLRALAEERWACQAAKEQLRLRARLKIKFLEIEDVCV